MYKIFTCFSYIFSCLLPFFLTSQIAAQLPPLVINEFLASNKTSNIDPDYSEFSDWIEIHNSMDIEINLGGYFLSDNNDNPIKWQFPDGVFVPENGYVIIWADGKNEGIHTNFKLNKGGEVILLFNPDTVLVDAIKFWSSVGQYFLWPNWGRFNTLGIF